jgi:hypothetical protein
MSTKPMVLLLAPDGTPGQVPFGQLHEALSAGAKVARKIEAPDGTPGYVSVDRFNDAVKAGAKPIPFGDTDKELSYWQQGWKNLTTPRYDRVPGGGEEMRIAEGAPTGAAILGGIGTAGAGLEAAGLVGSAGPSLAPLAPLVRGVVGSAAGGFVGREAGKVVGQEKIGGELGALAGGIYGAGGGKIPTNMAEFESVMQSPEAKARAAQEIEGQEASDALKLQDNIARRAARDQAAVARAEAKAAKEAAKPAAPFPSALGPEAPTPKQLKSVAAQPEPSPIVAPGAVEAESEGRPATWQNLRVSSLASKGGPLTFDAAKQAQLRQLEVPNVGMVADPRATAVPDLSPVRSRTLFDANGQPIGGQEPNWIYRTRDVGERGLPADQRSPAHLTSSLEQAQSFVDSRQATTGKPQEIVRFDANSLKPGEATVRPFGEGVDWYKLHRPFPEAQVEVVQPAKVESE